MSYSVPLLLVLTTCIFVCLSYGETRFDTVGQAHISGQGVMPILQAEILLQKPPISTSGPVVTKFQDPNLHPEHYPYYFTHNPQQANICRADPNCLYKDALDQKACWGYEEGCQRQGIADYPRCYKHHEGWLRLLPIWRRTYQQLDCDSRQHWMDSNSYEFHPTLFEDVMYMYRAETVEIQQEIYWNRTDFGYVKEMRDNQVEICTPKIENGSSLVCSPHLHACHAKNLVFNFTQLQSAQTRNRYKKLPDGYISVDCDINQELQEQHGTHRGDMQSWVKELSGISTVSTKTRQTLSSQCDVVLNKPTYLMKLDAGINMYHHFCDFVNLYITQHYNQSFSTDVYIVMWDTTNLNYADLFSETWQAFSDYPIIQLKNLDGKTVCMPDAVFTSLPRMIMGFFYNMPVVPDCRGSTLIRAFSKHVLHRLGVQQHGPVEDKLRITILKRESAHRNIINQNELVDELKKHKEFDVIVVQYSLSQLSFVEQLKVTHNTDIFIGMHGAGLTHLLFLPDWAVIFELCNCGDIKCYMDLANLRGVHYMTWQNWDLLQKHNQILHPNLKTPHAKFCDYSFNKIEFMRLVQAAAQQVRTHPKYRQHTTHDEL